MRQPSLDRRVNVPTERSERPKAVVRAGPRCRVYFLLNMLHLIEAARLCTEGKRCLPPKGMAMVIAA